MYTQSMCDDFFVFFGYYYMCKLSVYLRKLGYLLYLIQTDFYYVGIFTITYSSSSFLIM